MTATPVSVRLQRAINACAPERVGTVRSAVGLSVDVTGVRAATGDLIHLGEHHGAQIPAEVVAVTPEAVRCMPLAHARDLRVGMPARRTPGGLLAPVGPELRGRIIDGLGEPLDGQGPLHASARVPIDSNPPNPLERQRVDQPLGLGVRALDTLVPAGQGQRFGLFAGSGVGKSSLLSMIARGTEADTVVLCLVGERGREVREFVEDDLGPDGLQRSCVVVSTSDQPAVVRLRAARLATRIAEYYRDQGDNVVLMMDSLTRFAMAQREIGLATGEPPATRGYPPSTFAMLSRLLERTGPGARGTITGIYTVLVDGDDHDEPIADAARSILDGHVVLDRRLATAGHFPSIDILGSVSRVHNKVTTPEQQAMGSALRRILAERQEMQDLIDVGAYSHGSNPLVDLGIEFREKIDAFLTQPVQQVAPAAESWQNLADLVGEISATAADMAGGGD